MSRWVPIALQYAFAMALAAAGYAVVSELGPGWLAALKERDLIVERPEFIAVLFAIPLLIAIRAHTLSDLPRVQQGLSLLLKGAFIAALTLALIDVRRLETTPRKAATVFVVDVSESIPEAALEVARAEVEKVWREALAVPADRRPEVRLVVFGNGAREVPLPVPADGVAPDSVVVPKLARLPVAAGQAPVTNLQAGIRLALTLFPEGALPRLVVATDGLETEGSLAAETPTLTRFGIPLHWLDLGTVERPSELMVLGFEVPDNIQPKVAFKVRTKVRASKAMRGKCEVQVDGLVETTGEHDLAAGDNTLEHELTIKEGGDKKIGVSCTPLDARDDRFATNNRFELPVKVPERPKVLYVEGDSRFQKNLTAALQEDFDVELRGARGAPSSLVDAERFDLIFISDVPRVADSGAEYLSSGQMRTLEQYARRGGGLVFAGGENSFGPGGWGQTILERDVLPVRLDVQRKQDTPNLALMLAIDRSGSMAGQKIELAKQAAMATAGVLQPDDLLGICAFDSKPGELVSLQRAANRTRISDAVSRLRSGGGTNIFAALDFSYNELTKVDAKVKHIILLTDGQSSPGGIIELASQAAFDRITISTVAVGQGSDQALLSRIAEVAGGRYYFTNSPESIPKLFLQETSEVTRKSLVEDRFVPRVDPRFRGLQMFRGINVDALPSLVGYVSTRPKPRAEVIMTSHLGEPILARWRLGLGRVVVWTSDVKNIWSHYWLKWPGYAKFWRQVVRDSLRTETEDPSYRMIASVDGTTLSVGVDAVDDEDRFIDGITSDVVVTDPNGKDHPLVLTQIAAGRYEGRLPLEAYGPYTVRGKHTSPADKDTTYRSFATVAWPFPDEHLVGAPDLTEVKSLAAATGGVMNPTARALFDVGDAKTEKRIPMWPEPLPWALGFLLGDVLLRRVRLYGASVVKWL
ncbi:MAG: VWA domain-containing protein [Deltaproteobacteria bacterium]|nr:VWA domain-containing protein [Deltaproteobacteria bacterium]